MKVFSFVILLLAITSLVISSDLEYLEFLTDFSHEIKSINNSYEIYSMVWSGKHYKNSAEIKDFFFAIPISFKTELKVDVTRKILSLNFVNCMSDMGNFKNVLNDGPLAVSSEFGPLLKFSSDYSKVDLSLDFEAQPNFEFSLLHLYQNKGFRNIQIKITTPNSTLERAFYITFDLFKSAIPAQDIEDFITFLKYLKPKRIN